MENKKLLLIVDDEPANIRLANSILKYDYIIRAATSGVSAIGQAQFAPKPDLILLDVSMPVMDGYEVCRKLKSLPATCDIPVIFLTGRTDYEDETTGFEVGAVDYIHKPFSDAVMKARVKTHLLLREAHEQLSCQLTAVQQELEMAHEIQLSILPSEPPKLRGLGIAARYIPMSAVAGDFYDYIPVDEKHLGVLIADVSGHGLPAALIASMLKIALSTQSSEAFQPARVLNGLNQLLHGKFRRHYVTAAYLYVDLERNIMRCGGAGHPAILLWSKLRGMASELAENGLFLGPFADATYSSMELPIAVGDRLLLYTDGALECISEAGEEFGADRLRQFLESNSKRSADGFLDALIRELWKWAGQAPGTTLTDDITLLAIDILPH
jgi:sigma-B regulation protein RsbU (phosphoserine phosphatase)